LRGTVGLGGVLVSVVIIGVAIYLWRNPHIAKAGED
jgi:hypothetical protein